MLTYTGFFLLVIATDITGTAVQVTINQTPDQHQCDILANSSLYKEPRYRKVMCVDGVALLSESLVNSQLNGLSTTLNQLQRQFR